MRVTLSLTFQGHLRSNVLHCTPIYGFLLLFNNNIGTNQALLQEIRVRNLGDPEFDLSRSLKVRCEGTNELPIYVFLLMHA